MDDRSSSFFDTPEEGPPYLTRRTMLAFGITGFALMVSGCHKANRVAAHDVQGFDPSMVLVKNPAYLKHPGPDGAVVKTRTAQGKDIVYRVDARGELVFDLAPNIREYYDGLHRNLAEISEIVRRRYPNDDPSQQIRDFSQFVRSMLANNILLTEQFYVWST